MQAIEKKTIVNSAMSNMICTVKVKNQWTLVIEQNYLDMHLPLILLVLHKTVSFTCI
jgi:hypothetical protein